MGVAPLATHRGLGADYGRATTRRKAFTGALLALVVAAVVVGQWAAPLVAVVLVTIVSVRWISLRKIGGINGDVLGTCEQIAECLCLVVLTGIAAHHALR
jgi:adenosylcobinamide-GDP ribazoletransferase